MSTDPVLDAIQAVRDDVRTNHAMLTQRIDQMVSKDVHDAEIRRIDSAHSDLRKSHETLAVQVASGDAAILERLDRDLRARESKEKDDLKARTVREEAELESAKQFRRWLLNWLIGAFSLAVGAATLISKFIIGG